MTIDIERLRTDAAYWRECGAPEDAKFYGPEIKDWAECWYKKDPAWSAYFGGCWNEFGYDDELLDAFFQQRLGTLIPRPQSEWVDGLPPVGTVCEVIFDDDDAPYWFDVEYHGMAHGAPFLYDIKWDRAFVPNSEKFRFRPIPTKAQRDREDLKSIIADYEHYGHDYVTDKIIAEGWTKP